MKRRRQERSKIGPLQRFHAYGHSLLIQCIHLLPPCKEEEDDEDEGKKEDDEGKKEKEKKKKKRRRRRRSGRGGGGGDKKELKLDRHKDFKLIIVAL